MQDGRSVHVPWPKDFSLPVRELAQSRAKLTCVANPNAPFGNFSSLEQLEALAQQVSGLLVI